MLRHLPEIGAFAAFKKMVVDRTSECRNDLEKSGSACKSSEPQFP